MFVFPKHDTYSLLQKAANSHQPCTHAKRAYFPYQRGGHRHGPKEGLSPPNLLKLVAESRELLLHLDKHISERDLHIPKHHYNFIRGYYSAEMIELILGATCFHPSQQNTVPFFCAVKFYSFACARK